MTILANVR